MYTPPPLSSARLPPHQSSPPPPSSILRETVGRTFNSLAEQQEFEQEVRGTSANSTSVNFRLLSAEAVYPLYVMQCAAQDADPSYSAFWELQKKMHPLTEPMTTFPSYLSHLLTHRLSAIYPEHSNSKLGKIVGELLGRAPSSSDWVHTRLGSIPLLQLVAKRDPHSDTDSISSKGVNEGSGVPSLETPRLNSKKRKITVHDSLRKLFKSTPRGHKWGATNNRTFPSTPDLVESNLFCLKRDSMSHISRLPTGNTRPISGISKPLLQKTVREICHYSDKKLKGPELASLVARELRMPSPFSTNWIRTHRPTTDRTNSPARIPNSGIPSESFLNALRYYIQKKTDADPAELGRLLGQHFNREPYGIRHIQYKIKELKKSSP